MIDAIRAEFISAPLIWTLIALLAGLLIGAIYGAASEAAIWRAKSDPKFRTAMCSASRFYYVVPEREFIDMDVGNRAHRRFEQEYNQGAEKHAHD